MASINVNIKPEEKNKMIVVISKHKNETISVANLAKEAGYNPNRVRFIIEEMLQDGSIRKVPTKAFNAKFIRYKYEVTGK